MASHSRFTDDIYSTPAPSSSLITVRKKDELYQEILSSRYHEKKDRYLLDAEEIRSKELYEKYRPNFRDRNKNFIFTFTYRRKKYLPSAQKSLLITRWCPLLPHLSSASSYRTQIQFRPDLFTYESNSDHQTVEWHLNFANEDLFAYYDGPLLAQDELQVLECIELAALREYLIRTRDSISSRTTQYDLTQNRKLPTPSNY